jgi:hypothetical protein
MSPMSRYKARLYRKRVISFIGTVLAFWLGAAWSMMLSFGIAHDNYWQRIPPMGYGTAVVLTLVPLAFGSLILIAVESIKELTP